MALMNYYNQSPGSNQIDITDSHYTKKHTFSMEIVTPPGDKDAIIDFFGSTTIPLKITGIIEELPEIGYKTTWGDSPAAVLNDKIKKFTENKWIKMFAYQTADYRPPLLTDAWTQQIPKAAEPLSISIKFRAYPIDKYYNTTIYSDIIRYLIFVTTPKSFLLSDSLNAIKAAYKNATEQGEVLGTIVNELMDKLSNGADIDFQKIANQFINNSSDTRDLSKDEEVFYNGLNDIVNFINNLGNMNDEFAGGCPLIKFGITDLINNNTKLKWLIKSWSFKPALNVTDNNEPISVDFTISLETQYIPSTEDLESLLVI